MTQQATGLSVRTTITVEVAQERAFQVFTEQMGFWWPFATKSIGSAEPETAVVEPRAGGRWYERGIDGSECEWGKVIAYEPSERVILNWQIGAEWSYDPSLTTEVEVRFIAEDRGRTRVELEHRGLEAYGEQAQQMQAVFDSPDGWTDILTQFSEEAGE